MRNVEANCWKSSKYIDWGPTKLYRFLRKKNLTGTILKYHWSCIVTPDYEDNSSLLLNRWYRSQRGYFVLYSTSLNSKWHDRSSKRLKLKPVPGGPRIWEVAVSQSFSFPSHPFLNYSFPSVPALLHIPSPLTHTFYLWLLHICRVDRGKTPRFNFFF